MEDEVILRDYNHQTDFQDVIQNLKEADMYDKVWEDESRVKQRSEQKPDTMIVATVNNQVVGSVFLIDDFYPMIFRLVVSKDFRKKGIGTKLINEAIRRLKLHGHSEVDLFVDVDNPELIAWYEKQGFKGSSHNYKTLWKEI